MIRKKLHTVWKTPARPWKPSTKSDAKSYIMTVSESIIFQHSLWMTNAKGIFALWSLFMEKCCSCQRITYWTLLTYRHWAIVYCVCVTCASLLWVWPIIHNSQILFPATLDETRNHLVFVMFWRWSLTQPQTTILFCDLHVVLLSLHPRII